MYVLFWSISNKENSKENMLRLKLKNLVIFQSKKLKFSLSSISINSTTE